MSRPVRVVHASTLHGPTLATMLATWAASFDLDAELVAVDSVAGAAAALDGAPEAGVVLEPGDLDHEPALLDAVRACPAPVVLVDLLGPGRGGPGPLAEVCEVTIAGRGIEGHRWALRHLRDRARWPAEVVRYGDGPRQWAELRVPAGPGPHPVAVVVHGGSWRGQWGLDLMVGIAADLAAHGVATLNVELRLVHTGGGWTATFDDVTAAIDHVAALAGPHHLDVDRLAVVGHSSGGHLALWSALRPGLEAHGGRRPELRPTVVLSLAGVADVVEGDRRATGEGDWAARDLLGGHHHDVPERYRAASPAARLPIGVPLVLVQGLADRGDLVERCHAFAEQAEAAGDDVALLALPGVDHFMVIEADHPAWTQARDALLAHLAPGAPTPTGAS